jgi:hypothetical protein
MRGRQRTITAKKKKIEFRSCSACLLHSAELRAPSNIERFQIFYEIKSCAERTLFVLAGYGHARGDDVNRSRKVEWSEGRLRLFKERKRDGSYEAAPWVEARVDLCGSLTCSLRTYVRVQSRLCNSISALHSRYYTSYWTPNSLLSQRNPDVCASASR